MIKTTVALVTLAVVSAGAPSAKSVSVSTDANVDGVDGLNLNWQVPFKVDDYIVGFRYKLNQARRTPDTLFAKKTFDVADGKATVDADLDVGSKTLSVAAKWVSDKLGLTVNADANSKDHVTRVGAEKTESIDGNDVTVRASYDVHSNKIKASARVTHDKTSAEASYNTADEDIVLAVSHDLDDQNTLSPTYSTKSGKVAYGWTRRWNGGELDATYISGDKAILEWTDKGKLGDWKTKAEVPLEDTKNIKVSINREWKY